MAADDKVVGSRILGTDAGVKTVGYSERPDGTLEVTLHQVEKDLQGNVKLDGTVRHVYTIEDHLLRRMDIEAV
jgi:hypothetical protein